MAKRYYKVAEHQFSVDADEDMFSLMQNYEPFVVNDDDACDAVFSLSIVQGAYVEYVEEMRQSEEGQDIICGHTAENLPTFEFVLRSVSTGMLVCSKDYKSAKLYLPEEKSKTHKFSIDNALMVLYALATANLGTTLFHAAVVTYQNCGYLFLGKSGTGKSTHARLWLRHIAGTELLNDDNPVVRFFEDGLCAKVYGSPWSGKTPCYKNMDAPLGGFVLLEQAPHNKIERLRGVSAYAALLPSISGKRWDRAIADGLHRTENSLASHVPVWHLECLPDEAAAKLCCETIA